GLIPDEIDDPEYDGEHQGETPARPARKRDQPIREFEVQNFEEACQATNKTPEQILAELARFQVSSITELRRRDFKQTIRWASNGAGTLAQNPRRPRRSKEISPCPSRR